MDYNYLQEAKKSLEPDEYDTPASMEYSVQLAQALTLIAIAERLDALITAVESTVT